ncbi:hypothetical protein Q4511_15260 [Paracoccus sp. 1_MG-2023]|uniref:hypothetical protein n=1 Tax=unclassified Paracoccus (in: a-proteobacteria) TaxID=2688777 RepID=UPI001C09ADB9|nr:MULTISPECIES: hypothetical protein [unclassified Paracoccus (in: a-proteobacteria)]MBU2958362.1 hypothetical protein [Paracoccus sp. C2R09]MDO6670281.1 hypothetical protein [Paracoccus sp. 1_MG-2023]
MKREAEHLGDAARDVGKEAYGRLSEGAAQQTEQVKEGAASEVQDISAALRSAADKSRAGSAQERTFGQAAEALADFSDMIRNKDLGEMLNDVNGLARRNPAAFLGGAALLGFAATRFAKASASPDHGPTGNAGAGAMSATSTPSAPTPATSTPSAGMPASPAINTVTDPSDTVTIASKEKF